MTFCKYSSMIRLLDMKPPKLSVVSVLCLLSLLLSHVAYAEFSLNFIPSSGSLSSSVYQGGAGEEETLNNQTPFLFDGTSFNTVIDPDTGLEYYHMIIGSAAEGFLQETYIEVNSVPGAMSVNDQGQLSLSGTDTGDNGHDPLGIVLDELGTGNGQANPRRVVVRQIVNDGEIMMEFKKDKLLMKPVIRQIVNDSGINGLFQLDMRNSTYDDDTSAGLITNILNVKDGYSDGGGNFNMATDVDNSQVTGGRYTYIDGVERGGTSGTYQYIDGGDFDVDNVQWENYFDHSVDNPWAYELLRPTP